MENFFSVETIAFTLLGYPMSYVEFIGTIFYLWSVWLISKRNILTWPVGIISVLLYMILFYQIRLYADALEQIYYLGISIYGWWFWNQSPHHHGTIKDVRYSHSSAIRSWAAVTGILSLALGFAMSHIHRWLPSLFPEAASFPYLDSLTTVMSFSAMGLMTQKKTESWVYWIIVDTIGIGLYFVKEVKFISLLYVLLLMLSLNGFRLWHKVRSPKLG